MPAPPIVQANKQNLLALIQAACREMGVTTPTFIIGNSDDQVLQLLALANREAREFYEKPNKNGGWQELRKEHRFTTDAITGLTGDTTTGSAVITNISSTTGITAGTWGCSGNGIPQAALVSSVDSGTQVTLDSVATATATGVALSFGQAAYSLPSDFAYFMTQTFWDRAFRWQLLGPLEAQEWQVLKSGISPVGPRRRFRIMGNYFWIDPVPSSEDTEVFEYYSNAWCQSSTGTAQTSWAADTDYYTLDDDCFIMGLKWRFLRAKGLDYSQEFLDYERACERKMARNGGNRNLPLNASASGIRLLNSQNVPDTGFGS